MSSKVSFGLGMELLQRGCSETIGPTPTAAPVGATHVPVQTRLARLGRFPAKLSPVFPVPYVSTQGLSFIRFFVLWIRGME